MLFENLLVRNTSGFSWSRTLTYFIALIAFLSFLGSAKQFLVSNTYYSVKNSLDGWSSTPSSVSVKEVEIALTKIEEVIDKTPNNALYYQLEGQLYEWLHFSFANDSEVLTSAINQTSALQSAALSYKESLKLRPNWSGGWIYLSKYKIKK